MSFSLTGLVTICRRVSSPNEVILAKSEHSLAQDAGERSSDEEVF